MVDLDDPNQYQNPASRTSAAVSIAAFPEQLTQAWQESMKLDFPAAYKQIKNVVACGMGGSRFTPLIVKELFKDKLKVPYIINDDYALPGFVDEQTLVILSSYSGSTEEVLSCGRIAATKGALLTGITAGGKLADFLREKKVPFYQFNPIHNPSGQPRIGVGYMTAGHMGLAYAVGILSLDRKEVESALKNLPQLLAANAHEYPLAKNTAKQLAQIIYQKYPYVVTAEFLQGFGNAFANALNETAKSISSARVIPELNHHLMEGLKFPETLKEIGLFIFFSSQLYDERIQKRFVLTREIVENNGFESYTHTLNGKTKVEQIWEAIGFGSYTTFYLSVLYGQDPNSIPWVDYFKQHLKS